MGTHLRYSAGPCSCDRSTGAPNRARDRSACCVRFVSFERGVIGFAGSISEDDVNDRSSTPRDQDTLRKVGGRTKDEEEDETKIEKNE